MNFKNSFDCRLIERCLYSLLLIILLVLFDWRRVRSLLKNIFRLVLSCPFNETFKTIKTHIQLVNRLLTDILINKRSHLIILLPHVLRVVCQPQPNSLMNITLLQVVAQHHLMMHRLLNIGGLLRRIVAQQHVVQSVLGILLTRCCSCCYQEVVRNLLVP